MIIQTVKYVRVKHFLTYLLHYVLNQHIINNLVNNISHTCANVG